jgi:hypothetical protein
MRRTFYLYPNKKGFFIAEFLNPETGPGSVSGTHKQESVMKRCFLPPAGNKKVYQK